jgi:AP-1 complex subunit mu
VEVKIEKISSTKLEYTVKAKSNFKNRSIANNVDIFVPVPNDLHNATFKSAHGTVSYMSDREDILWNIKQFEGQTEMSMICTFFVPTIRIGKYKFEFK